MSRRSRLPMAVVWLSLAVWLACAAGVLGVILMVWRELT